MPPPVLSVRGNVVQLALFSIIVRRLFGLLSVCGACTRKTD